MILKTIAILSNTSWYIYNFRRNTITSLIDKGFRVVVISSLDNYSEKLKDLGAEFYEIKINPRGLNPFKEFLTLINIYIQLKKSRANLTLNFTPKINIYSSIVSRVLSINAINNIAGLGTVFVKKNYLSLLVRYLYKVSQKKVGFIFFQNEEDRELFLKFKIIKKEKTYRLPGSGVDLNRFSVNFKQTNENERKFILVCRMLKEKGVIHYLNAAEILREKYGDKVSFYLLGFTDDSNPSFVSLAEIKKYEEKGCVTYLGVSDKIEDIISTKDCVVLPSYYREGVPRSLLEAAAMGKAIVTTNNVGCKDVVDDGINGYLCQPDNLSDLVCKLELVINMSNEKLKEFGLKGRAKVEKSFDEKIVVNKYIEEINYLLK